MYAVVNYGLLCSVFLFNSVDRCTSDLLPPPPSLFLYSPGEPEHTDVLVKRIHDNLTLVCELRGDLLPRHYVWNYVAGNHSGEGGDRPFTTSSTAALSSSTLTKSDLQVSDSGHYMCSAPPFSVTKYILVQERGPQHCARGAFWCGARCVLAWYVCDGRADCVLGEDESPHLCSDRPCARNDKLNCSSGRCISESACCRPGDLLCRQPDCCNEHPRYSRPENYLDEYPALFEDRHQPSDDYGFIQSTIYTVTACALIFMIAVVLLVSAICKMHMKRAALRSYAHAERATAHHYSVQYAQAHRFPPCYEASRLLEQEGRVTSAANSPIHSQHVSPVRQNAQQTADSPTSPAVECTEDGTEECRQGFGLARLSAMFTARYRQVPTQPDVEMTDVRSTSLNSSPTRQSRLDNYRSPTYCDLNATDFYFTNPDTGDCGRDLNYMATPVEYYRRRALRGNGLQRVIEQLNDTQRPLTLQLGRFQLSIPRFGRRSSTDRRPDTPNVAEINIDDLDFVRLNSNETYTLNGRTIRLLGGNFENYPCLNENNRPPPYNEAMRYKLYGPPPEYLSRDALNNENNVTNNATPNVDVEARTNVEMPPNYEELASGGDNGNNVTVNNESTIDDSLNADTCNNNVVTTNSDVTTDNGNNETLSSVIDNLPAIDGVNCNDMIISNN